MAQEIGVAYVSLLPSGRGFSKAVEGEVDQAYANAERKGGGFFDRLGKLAKGVGLTILGIGATVGAIAITGGISRALNIEDASAKLKGLGHDTQAVESIMKDALASVKGTAFGLDSAATVAATAVAAGIKPGQELEKYLRLTADAATIAGVSMEEMGSILNKTTTSGRVFTQELNQLADRGLPIFQWLQEEYGVTAEELRKMVERGEVDAATFRKVIEENIGGAALASGDTTRGAFANMMAALSRFGAALSGPFLDAAKLFFGEMIVVFDGLATKLQPTFDLIQAWVDGINFDGLGERILAGLDPILGTINGFFDALSTGSLEEWMAGLAESSPALSIIGATFAALAPILAVTQDFIADIGDELLKAAPAFGEILEGVTPLIPVLGELLVEALEILVDLLPELVPLLIDMGNAIVDVVNDPATQGFLDWLVGLIGFLGTDTTTVLRDFAQSIRDLGPAFGGIADFVAGIAELFSGDSGFDVGANIAEAFAGVFEAVTQPFTAAWEFIVSIWTAITGFLTGVWEGIGSAVAGAWGGIGETIGGVMKIIYGIITGDLGLVQAQIGAFLSTVTGWWSSTWNGIVSFLSGVWAGIVAAISGGVSSAVSTVSTLPSRIMSFFAGAGSWLVSAGRDIVQGLINGISGMISSAVSAVQNLAGAALGAAKSFLGIQSPSRVFRDEVGRMIGEGLIAGVELTKPDVTASVNGLVPIPSLAGATGNGFPSTVTLVDADGSILTHARVIAGDVVSSFDKQQTRASSRGSTGF